MGQHLLSRRTRTLVFGMHELLVALQRAWPVEQWCDVTVVVAVSGGADSVALLRAVCQLFPHSSAGRVMAAHFNHALRPEADDDEAFVAELTQRLEIPLLVERASDELRSARPAPDWKPPRDRPGMPFCTASLPAPELATWPPATRLMIRPKPFCTAFCAARACKGWREFQPAGQFTKRPSWCGPSWRSAARRSSVSCRPGTALSNRSQQRKPRLYSQPRAAPFVAAAA